MRYSLIALLLSGLVVTFGCRHVAGPCDCERQTPCGWGTPTGFGMGGPIPAAQGLPSSAGYGGVVVPGGVVSNPTPGERIPSPKGGEAPKSLPKGDPMPNGGLDKIPQNPF
ncbi:MAG: hypothetical protein ACFCD0_07995 [Gemmataceae bacterium]